ncbi:MAG: TlpA family protein disulfide reductase [Bdellovibrionaceae bacterium]|nr:TlpA family protein disulfide reductase [Pseudobdellovibrionaceae bacterium]
MNKHLRALIVVFITVLFFSSIFFIIRKQRREASEKKSDVLAISIDKVAPDFDTKTIHERSISLSQFKGKLVILNFWASWCGPCVEEMPSLIKLIKSMPKDIELIAISGDSNIEDIHSFIKSFPELNSLPNIHLVFDRDKVLSQQYEVFRLPESFVIGKDQKIIKKISGTINWHSEEALEYMKKLVSP